MNKVVSKVLFLVALLVPLVFSPLAVEYFESPKILLLALLAVFIFSVWVYDSIKNKKVVIQKNSLALPICAFVVTVLVSYTFSQDKILSTYGYFGRLINSLPFYLIIAVLLIGLINVLKEKVQYKKVIFGLVTGLNLLGVWTLIQHFGLVPVWLSDKISILANTNFNPMGTAVLVPFVLILNLSLASLLYRLSEKKTAVYYLFTTLFLSIFTLSVTAGPPNVGQNWLYYAFLFLSIGLTVAFSNKDDAKRNKMYLMVLASCLLVSLVVTNINPFKSALKLDTNPYVRETTLGLGFGWEIMGGTLAESPTMALFGSGPDTFIEDFSKYKPLEYNSTNFWSVRLSRGSGELMEMLSNLGFVPVFMFCVVLFVAARMALKSFSVANPYSPEMKSLSALLLSMILLGVFFVWNTVVWFILLIVLVGLVLFDRLGAYQDSEIALSLNLMSGEGEKKDYLPAIFMVGVLSVSVASANFFVRSYLSDCQYKESLKFMSEENYEESLDAAVRSVQYCDNKDYPHRQVALQSLVLLEKISAEEEPDQNAQSAFLGQIISETKRFISFAPVNVENWETASIIYQRLINLTDGQYGAESVNALQNAIVLDPNKPQLYEALGVLYARAEEYDTAKQQIEYAINLLPGYFRPYLTLAEVYELEGDLETSIKLLEAAKQLLPEDSEVIPLINEKIENLENGEASDSLENESIEDIVEEVPEPIEEYSEDGDSPAEDGLEEPVKDEEYVVL